MLRPIETKSMQDLVHDQLSEALMAGAFRPGEMLNLNALAQSFGTSLMPVRDAVRRLAADEALVVEPQRGARVRVHTAAEFAEMSELRAELEGDLTERAVRSLDQATRDALLERLEGLLRAEDAPSDFLRLNRDFYFALYAAADRPVTMRLVRSLWQQVGPVITLYLQTESGSDAMQRLADFGQALRSAQAKNARDLRCEQIMRPSAGLLSQYDKVMGTGRQSAVDVVLKSIEVGSGSARRPGRKRRNT
ncbi:GntR family transcriptional regulator [Pararhodobacter sp.]|uniref:GntR family transcriptional regulator n=1 Tax=Pararhodobacter sp. TaxID=2127056 RepID=UPI002AFFCC61|nr:GntR family transcriptional regulator [Pararhodobacter sp.]